MGVVRLRSLALSMSMMRSQKSISGVARVVLRNAPYKIDDRTNNLSTIGCIGVVMLPLLLLLHILPKGLSIGEEKLLMKQDLLESFAK